MSILGNTVMFGCSGQLVTSNWVSCVRLVGGLGASPVNSKSLNDMVTAHRQLRAASYNSKNKPRLRTLASNSCIPRLISTSAT